MFALSFLPILKQCLANQSDGTLEAKHVRCVYVSLCLSACLSVYLCVCVYLCFCVCVHLCVCVWGYVLYAAQVDLKFTVFCFCLLCVGFQVSLTPAGFMFVFTHVVIQGHSWGALHVMNLAECVCR